MDIKKFISSRLKLFGFYTKEEALELVLKDFKSNKSALSVYRAKKTFIKAIGCYSFNLKPVGSRIESMAELLSTKNCKYGFVVRSWGVVIPFTEFIEFLSKHNLHLDNSLGIKSNLSSKY